MGRVTQWDTTSISEISKEKDNREGKLAQRYAIKARFEQMVKFHEILRQKIRLNGRSNKHVKLPVHFLNVKSADWHPTTFREVMAKYDCMQYAGNNAGLEIWKWKDTPNSRWIHSPLKAWLLALLDIVLLVFSPHASFRYNAALWEFHTSFHTGETYRIGIFSHMKISMVEHCTLW